MTTTITDGAKALALLAPASGPQSVDSAGQDMLADSIPPTPSLKPGDHRVLVADGAEEVLGGQIPPGKTLGRTPAVTAASQGARKKLNFGLDETMDYHGVPLNTLKELSVSAAKQAEALGTSLNKMRKDLLPEEPKELDPRNEPNISSIYPQLEPDDDTLGVDLDVRRIAGPSSAATAGLSGTSPWPGFPRGNYDDSIERLTKRGSKEVRKSLEAASTASVKKPEQSSHVYYAADHNRRGKQRHSTSQDFYQRGRNHVYSTLPPLSDSSRKSLGLGPRKRPLEEEAYWGTGARPRGLPEPNNEERRWRIPKKHQKTDHAAGEDNPRQDGSAQQQQQQQPPPQPPQGPEPQAGPPPPPADPDRRPRPNPSDEEDSDPDRPPPPRGGGGGGDGGPPSGSGTDETSDDDSTSESDSSRHDRGGAAQERRQARRHRQQRQRRRLRRRQRRAAEAARSIPNSHCELPKLEKIHDTNFLEWR